MIKATILCNNNGVVLGFCVTNHGLENVCAAVSMLAINTVNSIEKLTELTEGQDFNCRWVKQGGFIGFMLKSSDMRDFGAGILLDTLVLGLSDLSRQYPNDITFSNRFINRK